MTLSEHMQKHLITGRIKEISQLAEQYYDCRAADLTARQKLDALCAAMQVCPEEIDAVITQNSEVSRTIKGHVFEVAFDRVMADNGILCEEVGGDSDVDRKINGHTLQLKTRYENGCRGTKVSYKTHKTHGAKSRGESIKYYHAADTFPDYMVALVSYRPFQVLIVPRDELPRVPGATEYIESPMCLETMGSPYLNAFDRLGIQEPLHVPEDIFCLRQNEELPLASAALGLRSDYILQAIFTMENFRIWDMNMRGFLREQVLFRRLRDDGIRPISPEEAGTKRTAKRDVVLHHGDGDYHCFQVKGLTWRGCKLAGEKSVIDCETQLTRGRVNDHPTQSRLYQINDFDAVIFAVDPPYANALSREVYGKPDYTWRFFCVPVSELWCHHVYSNRIASHKKILYRELKQWEVDAKWLEQWKKESA